MKQVKKEVRRDEEETSPEAEPETDETPKKVGDVTEKPANTQQITGAGGEITFFLVSTHLIT